MALFVVLGFDQVFHAGVYQTACQNLLDSFDLDTVVVQLDHVPDGEIILIRFIRSDCKLDIFGEKFQVSKDLAYSYVKAVIVTSIHNLQVYLGSELVDTFDYHLTA